MRLGPLSQDARNREEQRPPNERVIQPRPTYGVGGASYIAADVRFDDIPADVTSAQAADQAVVHRSLFLHLGPRHLRRVPGVFQVLDELLEIGDVSLEFVWRGNRHCVRRRVVMAVGVGACHSFVESDR